MTKYQKFAEELQRQVDIYTRYAEERMPIAGDNEAIALRAEAKVWLPIANCAIALQLDNPDVS